MDGPLLSVVIPVGDVAGCLSACLDSVLCEDGPGLEVIAVDDSHDGCSAILAERARRDRRLRIVRDENATGPGPARNTGLARAAGRYVWFADADDTLAPGALRAVAGVLERDRPDLLLIGYQEVLSGGRAVPGPGGRIRRAAAPGPVTLAERPELLELTMTAWSKVMSRALLSRTGQAFAEGIHEDVPVSAAALLAAERICVLDRPCYRYRRGRDGSFMATRSDAHFAIFRAYQRVFELAAMPAAGGQPPGAPVREAIFRRAIWHYCNTLPLVPRGSRRAFFRRMHADFAAYRPAEYRHPPGLRGIKFRLVERDCYLTYSVLEPLNRLRVGAVSRTD
jgi:CDP-glycerol glycerophosphotransferase